MHSISCMAAKRAMREVDSQLGWEKITLLPAVNVFLKEGTPIKRLRTLFFLLILAAGMLLLPPAARTSAAGTNTAIGGCSVFPTNNIWNKPVNTLPVSHQSRAFIKSIGQNIGMHPDFGSGTWDGAPIGIPYTTVEAGQSMVPVSFDDPEESDAGPYPIPTDAPIEEGDGHVLVVDQSTCKLYELYAASPQSDGSWHASSGAIFDLTSNLLRPRGWTSADAAGLPILPGLVRHAEVASGVITHALRFTVAHTRNTYVWPARHEASSRTSSSLPPMGERFRLKAKFDISHFSHDTQVILTALKTYEMFIADNGSNLYLNGVPDPAWNNDALVSELGQVKGSAFEAVDESKLMVDSNSGQSK